MPFFPLQFLAELFQDQYALLERGEEVYRLLDHETIDSAERTELTEQSERGDANARNELIERHIRFVAKIVNRNFKNTGIPFEDLVSIGIIGLIKAVDRFDPKKGTLINYASRCIKNEILLFLRKDKKRKMEVSLDQKIDLSESEAGEATFFDLFAAEDDVAREAEINVLMCRVHKEIDILPQKEKILIEHSFGLGGKQERTLKEAGEIVGIGFSYASRVRKRILEKLRKRLDSS